MKAFDDTVFFSHMADPESIKTKFILSPFISNFPTGSSLEIRRDLSNRVSRYTTGNLTKLKTQKTLQRQGTLHFSVVDAYLQEIEEQKTAKA